MAATQQENLHEDVASELCGDQESAIVLGRSSGRRVGSRNVVASFSTDPTSSVSSTCSPLCPLGRPLRGTRTPGTLVLATWIPRWSCPPEDNLRWKSGPKGHLLINIVKGIFNRKKNSRTGHRCNRSHRVCLGIVDQRAGSLFPRLRRF